MRWKGVHHVDINVLDYENSIEFYDEMFGWLGYKSLWSVDVEYHSTYYMARYPFVTSYIGVQPAFSLHPDVPGDGCPADCDPAV